MKLEELDKSALLSLKKLRQNDVKTCQIRLFTFSRIGK